MNGKYLFDTSLAVDLVRGLDEIQDEVDALEEDYFLSSVVVGELRYGAEKSRFREQNLAELQSLVSDIPVLPCDLVVAAQFGQVKAKLKSLGRPIPDNDIWIAATALANGLVLISRDAHFDNVPGLSHELW